MTNFPYSHLEWFTFVFSIIRFPEFLTGIFPADFFMGIQEALISKNERMLARLFVLQLYSALNPMYFPL